MLIHSDNTFFQYLEGDKADLEELYDVIQHDRRHHDCQLELLEPINQKIFPGWNMGYKDLDTSLVEFNTEMNGDVLLELEKLIYGAPTMTDKGLEMLRSQLVDN